MHRSQLTLISLVLIVFTSFSLKKKPTDLKENCLKGKVKAAVFTHYSDLYSEDGAFPIDESKIQYKAIWRFNEDGNIYEKEDSYLFSDDEWETITTKVFFDNGKKSSFKTFKSNGEEDGHGRISWTDEYNYSLYGSNGSLKSLLKVKLNSDLAIESGTNNYESGSEVMFSTSYSYHYSKRGELEHYSIYDNLTEENRTFLYTQKKLDSNGNITEVALIDEASGKLESFVTTSYEYY